MATIPVLKIKKFVDLLLEFIRVDYENVANKENSFLYRILGDNQDNGWNFYENAVAVFTRQDDDSRKLETRLMFDRSRAGLPTIHVREPAKTKGTYDGIGFFDEDIFVNEDNTISSTARKTFRFNFELMVTSGNSLECVMIQEVLESAMLSSFDTLTIPFFEIIDFSSKELMMADDTERNMLFMKSITLDVQYEKTQIPKLYTEENIKKIKFNSPELLDL